MLNIRSVGESDMSFSNRNLLSLFCQGHFPVWSGPSEGVYLPRCPPRRDWGYERFGAAVPVSGRLHWWCRDCPWCCSQHVCALTVVWKLLLEAAAAAGALAGGTGPHPWEQGQTPGRGVAVAACSQFDF